MTGDTTLIAALRAEVARLGSQRAVARAFGVSDVYICDLLHGRRTMSPKVARQLGFERVWRPIPVSAAMRGDA